MYLLDTNICIYIIKQKPERVLQRLVKHAVADVKISTITIAELMYGVEKSRRKSENELATAKFLAPFEIVPFDEEDAAVFGKIRADLESKGMGIGPHDLQLASQALNHSFTLVTNNEKEFRRVPDLKIENWVS